ncbi:Ig-like domain-containing protein [Escherichia coli]|nr:Ig-like domain-containing protein [Escherichia coli]
MTDAFGNALDGQTVSVLAGNGATVSPTVITGPDGTVEISVTSQTAGISAVTATINSSSQSRNVTFIADVRTAQITVLEVTQDNAVADGAMANTLRVRGDRCVRQCACRADGQRVDGQRRNDCPDGDHRAGRHGGNQCHQPDGGDQYCHCQHQQQQPEPERDVYRRYQDGADRGSGGH